MASGDFKITFEVEPIVKLTCLNTSCKYNLGERHGYICCDLKYVEINEAGKCSMMEVRKPTDDTPR